MVFCKANSIQIERLPDWAEGPTHLEKYEQCRAPGCPARGQSSPFWEGAAVAALALAAERSPTAQQLVTVLTEPQLVTVLTAQQLITVVIAQLLVTVLTA